MTNEEIEKEARMFYGMTESDIASRLRWLLRQAYEEAAQACDILAHSDVSQCGECAHACMSLRAVAADIRRLKDSLVQETVSSL